MVLLLRRIVEARVAVEENKKDVPLAIVKKANMILGVIRSDLGTASLRNLLQIAADKIRLDSKSEAKIYLDLVSAEIKNLNSKHPKLAKDLETLENILKTIETENESKTLIASLEKASETVILGNTEKDLISIEEGLDRVIGLLTQGKNKESAASLKKNEALINCKVEYFLP